MKALNYWQQFTHTGKIEDYLSYAGLKDEPEPGVRESRRIDTGDHPYAGIHMCDRNDIKTDAYRGI